MKGVFRLWSQAEHEALVVIVADSTNLDEMAERMRDEGFNRSPEAISIYLKRHNLQDNKLDPRKRTDTSPRMLTEADTAIDGTHVQRAQAMMGDKAFKLAMLEAFKRGVENGIPDPELSKPGWRSLASGSARGPRHRRDQAREGH